MLAFPSPDSQIAKWFRLVAILSGVYVVPVIALASGLIGTKWRFHVLIAMSLLALLLAFLRDHSITRFGMNVPAPAKIVNRSVLPSVVLVAVLVIAKWAITGFDGRWVNGGRLPFYAFFVFVSAPAQEFLYRSFLFAECNAARLPASFTILLSSLLFAFMHIIYKDALTLLLTFAAGVLWGIVFMRTRDFYAVALSHAILGVGALSLGFV